MKRILICAAGGSPSTNFVRSLRLAAEPYFLVGVDCDKYNLARAETDLKFLVPRVSDPLYLPVINNIIEDNDIEFVHFQNDYEVEFASENREKFKANLFLPDEETVRICMDKFRSYDAWEAAGIKVPKTVLLNSEVDLRAAFLDFGPKLWLRNVKGAAGNGSFPTDDYEEAVNWINFKKGWGHFTAAECLTEQTVTWMSIWYEGKLVVAQTRKREYWELSNRAPSGVTGVTGAGVTCSDNMVDEVAIASINAIDKCPHGIFSVDMTYDGNGVANPTEINIGRFFTTHLFFTQAGLNMPEIFVKLAYGQPFLQPSKKVNPLPDGLVWIRGVDFEPVLMNKEVLDAEESELQTRITKLGTI